MSSKNSPSYDPHGFTYPFKCTILKRPSNPVLVGRHGTALNVTEDQQIRVVMDSQPGEKWARTICCLPEDLTERVL